MAKDSSYAPDQGFVAEFDIKEDEEQNVKLQQTIELLLTAGYFRARIKGLSPFDKVVGGMTWCITTCSYDVNVDLLFQENSTIGQKIALTEKIVAVLPRMNCPHRIEPHQIQGLDFIHIFPVVQWLVKKAIESREEMGDYIRAYSISQFDKQYAMPEDIQFKDLKATAVGVLSSIKEVYRPRRMYKRHDPDKLCEQDEETRVRSTLFEYGKYRLRKRRDADKKDAKPSTGRSESVDEVEEERKLSELLSQMSMTDQHPDNITVGDVGSIVGMQSQAELGRMGKKSQKFSAAHHHKQMTASLQKQLDQEKSKLKEAKEVYDKIVSSTDEVQVKLRAAQELSNRIDGEMEILSSMETDSNQGIVQQLRDLVSMNESLKKQEKEFRAHCKAEMERLQAKIEDVKHETGAEDSDDEQVHRIEKQHAADKEKLQKILLLLARKNREISTLHRKIDEVPTRAELSQYQRRFVELYNQVATKHKETKQFYTLYNTLDDTKLYLNKEINLLNSIHETFEQAMSSPANKEQFLKQFDQINEGVKQNNIKLERKKQEEKMRRDRLNDQYLDLVEKQRVYYKTVKDFQKECAKNELLLAKLQ